MSSKNRHHCAQGNECNCVPTDRDLFLIGIEEWQISLIRRLPTELQWEVHDEFIRRFMSGDDTENFKF